MDRKMALYILDLQDRLRIDEEYQRLTTEHVRKNEQFLCQLKTMNLEQQNAVLDYLGLLIELHFKILEYTAS